MRTKGKVRIIGGRWRRRSLSVPDVAGLRPTSGRTRETVFNWLREHIEGAHCLDLFAGSGALGFEAASRGARDVVMVEANSIVVRALREHVRRFSATQIRVVQADALKWIQRTARPYDIVFLDPPFDTLRADELLQPLQSRGWLRPNALVYMEVGARSGAPCLPRPWRITHSEKAGRVRYYLATASTST